MWLDSNDPTGLDEAARRDAAAIEPGYPSTLDKLTHQGVIARATIACEDAGSAFKAEFEPQRTQPGCVKIPADTKITFDWRFPPREGVNVILVQPQIGTGPELKGYWAPSASVHCEDCAYH